VQRHPEHAVGLTERHALQEVEVELLARFLDGLIRDQRLEPQSCGRDRLLDGADPRVGNRSGEPPDGSTCDATPGIERSQPQPTVLLYTKCRLLHPTVQIEANELKDRAL